MRAGLRPFRKLSVRVEQDPGTSIFHNYGHGGAGVTFSWGCATEVAELVNQHLSLGDEGVSAGISGLAAVALRKIEDNWLSKLETQLQSSWILGRIGWNYSRRRLYGEGQWTVAPQSKQKTWWK